MSATTAASTGIPAEAPRGALTPRLLSFFSGASDVVPDKQGRISLPEHLRDYAGLTGDVWLAGHFDHIEIWNPDQFDEKKGEGTAKLHSTAGIAVLRGSE